MPKQAYTRTRPTSIKDVLKKAVPDILFAPMDQKLNWALRWTGAFLGAGVVAVFFLGGVLWSIADLGFFRSLAQVSLVPFFMLRTPIGIGLLLVALVTWGAMLWKTDGFKHGRLEWHQVGTALVAVGSITVAALTLPLLNFLVSAIVFVLAAVLVIGVLSAA